MAENRTKIGSFDYVNHFFESDALLVSMDVDGKPNVMALAWKTIGLLWGIPIISVAVAPSRYSFNLLTSGVKEFTVNIPSNKNAGAIGISGTFSGRNTDKFKEANLEIIDGSKTKVPTIKDCLLSYECEIVHSCKSGNMASHHLFFGQILAAHASNEIIK